MMGISVSQTLCAHTTSKPWLRYTAIETKSGRVYSTEAWTQPASWRKRGETKIMHTFVKLGGRNIKGG